MGKIKENKKYIICINSDYARDTQVYQPKSDESWENEDLSCSEFDSNWVDAERDLYLGVINAENEEAAIKKASDIYSYKNVVLVAYKIQ